MREYRVESDLTPYDPQPISLKNVKGVQAAPHAGCQRRQTGAFCSTSGRSSGVEVRCQHLEAAAKCVNFSEVDLEAHGLHGAASTLLLQAAVPF